MDLSQNQHSTSSGYNPYMTRWIVCATLLSLAGAARGETNGELKEQVRQTEIAFAKSMADRNAAAFASFLSKETIFLSNGRATRGAAQVASAWKRYFDGPKAPFSWSPEFVEVVDSGSLALSTGPVLDPTGKRIGTFNSVWRREGKGAGGSCWITGVRRAIAPRASS
jgi:ketosteroid isomerase-like protein